MNVLFKQIGRLKICEPHWNLVEELSCQHLSACVSQAIQYEFNAHQGLFLKTWISGNFNYYLFMVKGGLFTRSVNKEQLKFTLTKD